MSCDTTFEELSAYADGELSEERREELAAHLESCPDCRSQLDAISATTHRLAKVGARREPTDALRHKLEQRADAFREADSGSGPDGDLFSSRVALSAAGILVFAGIAAGIAAYWAEPASTSAPDDHWAELYVTDHLHSKPTAKPMDVATDNPEQLVQFFSGRVSFEPVVPELPETELVGGRDCVLKGRHVQLLFYRHRDRVLSLFVSDELGGDASCRRARGHSVCTDQRGPLQLMLVGKGSTDDLRRLVEHARIESG